jgi:hypothetical protein
LAFAKNKKFAARKIKIKSKSSFRKDRRPPPFANVSVMWQTDSAEQSPQK